jgi:hypothetical protein
VPCAVAMNTKWFSSNSRTGTTGGDLLALAHREHVDDGLAAAGRGCPVEPRTP